MCAFMSDSLLDNNEAVLRRTYQDCHDDDLAEAAQLASQPMSSASTKFL